MFVGESFELGSPFDRECLRRDEIKLVVVWGDSGHIIIPKSPLCFSNALNVDITTAETTIPSSVPTFGN